MKLETRKLGKLEEKIDTDRDGMRQGLGSINCQKNGVNIGC